MKLTKEETQALAFIASLLLISATARFLGRPGPVEIHGQPVSIAELQTESLALMSPAQQRTTAQGLGWLNLNAATEAEIAQIDNIGPALAAAIVAHREQAGTLTSVHDLREIPGMKKKALEHLADVASFGTWDDPRRLTAPEGRAALAQEPRKKPTGGTGTSTSSRRPPRPAPPRTPIIVRRPEPEREAAKKAVAINTSTAEELTALPGIGPALAARIIARRQTHGPFRDLAALDSVPGIGPALLQRLGPLLRF